MTIATISVTKERGQFTGRQVERFFVAINNDPYTEVDYLKGFEADGKTYALRTHIPTGALEVEHPETGKRIRLGKTGGTIDLSAWKKLSQNRK